MSLRPQQTRSWMAGLVGAALSLALLHCSVTPLGATDGGIAKARVASPPGADAFDRECASCHGRRGEGLTIAPAVMGVGALAEYPRNDASSSDPAYATSAPIQGDSAHVPGQAKREPFHTAQDVYDYVSSRMPLPKSAAGTLKPEEYWAIVNFLLIANGVAVPAGGVSEANAKSVALR
jgi:mono/diheme cytochrome c family protein